jgi:biotin synthase-related radical SAM superfamily protein
MTGTMVFKKAELISEGIVCIEKGLKLPYFLSCSGSGPDAGEYSVALSFGGHKLKIPVSRESKGAFALAYENGTYQIFKDGEPFIDNIEILNCGFHAPEQAFLDLNEGCVFDCAFCTISRSKKRERSGLSDAIVEKAIKAGKEGTVKAISITGGVVSNPGKTVNEMVKIITRIRKESDLPIGVEPYVDDRMQIGCLYSAGADEIKINIQSFDERIFKTICPQWDFGTTEDMIEAACDIFGKGRVTSNLIFGLGEDDGNVLRGIDILGAMGCTVNLRKVRVNDANEEELKKALGSIEKVNAERIMHLAENQKKILQDNGLDPRRLKTMCHPCGCCDIVPFVDI